MADEMTEGPLRGSASTTFWTAECKDCAAERRRKDGSGRRNRGKATKQPATEPGFQYSGNWAEREYELGHTRSDRCERHRRAHRQAIRALAVPYVDLDVIGQVRNRNRPTGPLGGLGPLPRAHRRGKAETELQSFGFGMSDADILEILAGLKDKRVAVIEAGTGSGKSTFMPFRLMNPPEDAPYRPTDNGPIVVTEPRRAAATGVATFVGEALAFGHNSRTCQAHVGPGFPVGYQVSGDRNWDNACDLVYVTDGTMINWVRDGSLARIGMVIVDEAHERSENIDIILAQLREKIQEYKHLRVIITSATIDRDFFVSYFGGEDHVFHHFVPEKKSFGYGVPLFIDLEVDDRIIGSGLTLQTDGEPIAFPGWSGFGPEHPGFPQDDLAAETVRYTRLRCVEEIPREQWRDDMPDALARQVVAIAEGTDWGDILGFLPTTKKIEEAISKINDGLEQRGLDFDVYPLLSSTDRTTTEKAISARVRGQKRKIVISSNLAETSLTVSGVRFVVDSGLICQSTWNTDLASGALVVIPHSRAGLRQRWGRVGRDAPGWVFPLYTIEQFLSLARDTPPESTRKNLESFCSKLISAGLNVEDAALPASFESPGFQPDDFGRQASDTFRSELTRAHRTLRTNGLVDGDGDLTELGREIERYPGEASEALAIALGDRLACLHEVALAIAVLVGGTLYGRRPDCILRTDLDWPPEWRLRAAACHRALAAGCADDLDLAVRVASLYRAAKDGQQWCRIWWVNEAALQAALEEVSSTVGNLSAAMKGKADRPISPRLLPRARAALTRAYHGLCFYRADDGTFQSVEVESSLPATLPERRLAGSAHKVIAFKRYDNSRDPANVHRHISHLVNAVDWAAHGTEGSDGGFDLLLELSLRRQSRTAGEAPATDPLMYARDQLPIGTVARFELAFGPDGLAEIEGVAISGDPFLAPTNPSSGGSGNQDYDEDSGFDRDWDLNRRENPIPEEAEEARKPVDPREFEDNDKATSPPLHITPLRAESTQSEAPPLFARLMFEGSLPEPAGSYLVSDYAIEDGRVFVLLEPFDSAGQNIDPAKHDKLELFDEIDVKFLAVAEDPYWSFLLFRHQETHERFDVPAKGFFSLDRFVETLARGLSCGLTFRAAVIAPRAGQRSITLKPWLRTQFDKAGTPQQTRDGQASRLYAAAIVADPDDRDNVVVELEDLIDPGEIALRTQVWIKWLGEEKGIFPEIGQHLRVGFEDLPDRKAELKPVTEKLEAEVAKSGGRLEIRGEKALALRPLHLDLVRRLIRLDSSERWAAAISALLEGSQIVRTIVALPPIRRSTLAASNLGASLLKEQRIEFEQRYNVRVKLDTSGKVELSTQDQSALNQANVALSSLESAARVSARLPEGTVGHVIGKKNQNRLALQTRTGIDWVWVDDGVVHVVGDSLTNVKRVIASINEKVSSATGIISVPTEQMGLFIGTGGANIKKASIASGCRADQIDKTSDFRLTGPSAENLERFAAIARQHARGSTLRLTSASQVTIIVEKKRSSTGSTKRSAVSSAQDRQPQSTAAQNRSTTPARKSSRSPATNRFEGQRSLQKPPEPESGTNLLLPISLALAAAVIVLFFFLFT